MFPSISIVVVSDFEDASVKTWRDELRCLQALGEQDIGQDVEIIVVENSALREVELPSELIDAAPQARVIFADSEQSAILKDYGVSQALGEWVAVIEADCVPARDWLRLLAKSLLDHPEVFAASGRTIYGWDSSYQRVLTLYDRSFDDRGQCGLARHISNNGALYRRETLLNYPYPHAITPFLSARMREKQILTDGNLVYFERAAVMRHAIGGLAFIADVRRNTGYSDMQAHGKRTWLKLIRLTWQRCMLDISALRHHGRDYLRWYDYPFALLLFPLLRVFETMGMIDAMKAVEQIPNSSYR